MKKNLTFQKNSVILQIVNLGSVVQWIERKFPKL